MGENDDNLVQVLLKIPRDVLEVVKHETCVESNATAIVAFVRKTLREQGLLTD